MVSRGGTGIKAASLLSLGFQVLVTEENQDVRRTESWLYNNAEECIFKLFKLITFPTIASIVLIYLGRFLPVESTITLKASCMATCYEMRNFNPLANWLSLWFYWHGWFTVKHKKKRLHSCCTCWATLFIEVSVMFFLMKRSYIIGHLFQKVYEIIPHQWNHKCEELLVGFRIFLFGGSSIMSTECFPLILVGFSWCLF